jgi:glycine hydroxymethyltransferase
MILCKKEFAKRIDTEVFPGIQGGPLMHVIAAKAVAFKEAKSKEFKIYQENVIRNAKRLCLSLEKRGFRIVSGGTDTHMVLVDLVNQNLSGKEAEIQLEKAGIIVNRNLIPYDKRPPLITSGIRLGTPGVTTRGMGESEMEFISDLIDRTLRGAKPERIKREVKDLTRRFPLYKELKKWLKN